MPRAEMQLPVFLPGNNRDWERTEGVATITAEGEIHIRLTNPGDAERLAKMAEERILLQLSFDYRQSDELLDKINARYRVECKNPQCPAGGRCGGRCARTFEKRVPIV